MTRKDYILLAEAMRYGYGSGCAGDIVKAVANALERDNPRFDREHFLAVVRGEKELLSRPARKGQYMPRGTANEVVHYKGGKAVKVTDGVQS